MVRCMCAQSLLPAVSVITAPMFNDCNVSNNSSLIAATPNQSGWRTSKKNCMSVGNDFKNVNSSSLRFVEKASLTCMNVGPRCSSKARIPLRNSVVIKSLAVSLPKWVTPLYILGQNKKSFPFAFSFHFSIPFAPYIL